MNDVENLAQLLQPGTNQLDLIQTLFNFVICILMAFVLRSFYINRSYSLSGKSHIGSILPVLTAVVFMVIVVVKSSLALSLGLVGALSIVRFRTPIKEPEELVYLFLAIAVGLGYGAGHTLLTTVLTSAILVVIYLWLSNRQYAKNAEYNLVLNWESEDALFEAFSAVIMNSVHSMSVVRLDRGPVENTAVLLISPHADISLDAIMSQLKGVDPLVTASFFEAKTSW